LVFGEVEIRSYFIALAQIPASEAGGLSFVMFLDRRHLFMWKIAFLAISAAIAIALQACAPKAQESCGFVQNVYGERISWKGALPIPLYIHESVPEEYIVSIQQAAKTWEDATGKKLFTVITDSRIKGPKTPLKDGKNIIYFMDESEWEPEKLEEQARTSIYWIGDQMKEADVRINGRFVYYPLQVTDTTAKKPNGINMQALIIHELGHVLGLKHKDAENSVMATYLSTNTDRVQIASTDQSAVQCEY
jgi:hypothetical protein